MSKFWKYFVIIAPIILVAVLGSVFVNLGMEWFNILSKPTQWIPNFVIPIVWTIIYIAFTVILSLLSNNTKFSIKTIVLLALNGLFNIVWCLLFFTFNLTFLGNIAIILNLILGFWVFINLLEYKEWYVYILLIYPIWLSIATSLNLALWILN